MMLRSSRYSLLLVLLALLACTLLQPQQGGVWVVSASEEDVWDDEAAAEDIVDEIVSHATERVEEKVEEKEVEPEPEEEEPEPEPEPPVKAAEKVVEAVKEKVSKAKININLPDIKSIVEKVKSKINVVAKKITGMKKSDVKKLVGAALGLWAASVIVGFLTAGTTSAASVPVKGKK